jgi:hypothetical protein
VDPIRLIPAASLLLACAWWILAAAPATAGGASSPFPDPPGHHRPVTPLLPGNSDAKNRSEIYSRIVPFESADRLDEYSVSGLWFPGEQVTFAGLSGPAIFLFKNVSSGKQFAIAVNTIVLLDEDFWNKHQVADAAQLEPEALLEKLTGLGTVSISLSQDMRAKIVNCEVSKNNPPPGNARVERCLNLGEAVVDLQDIDFDGKKELVFRHAGVGQRSGAAYEIMRVPQDDDPAYDPRGPFSREPFREIDWRTVINITRKQIILEGSNSAVDNSEETYSRDASGGMSMTHFWRSFCNGSNECYIEDYAVENQLDGIGRRFKLLSRKKAE